ncbi:unnamed protein product [Rotaria socialis]|uniref:Transposase n=1 Tax=Rotaria socialis TaxID=392032 RepID=A0A818S7M4_9BILA|nr:unnamed protein product [Rotaria socialis]CAF4905164.1 unnamed protein product [Rotaria socialis]
MERASSRHETTKPMRGSIIALHELGLSKTAIANRLGLTRVTVRKWIRRYEEEGDLNSRHRPGAPHCTTQHQDEEIFESAIETPLTTAVAITSNLQLRCSVDTVRNRLSTAGINHHIPATKSSLTQTHKDTRLGFALQYLSEDIDFWRKVIFTDEKTFSTDDHGQLHCWRTDGTRFKEQNVAKSRRSGRITAGMWGWMCGYGVGELCEINGRFTSDQYIEVLEEVMIPTVRAIAIPEPEDIYLVQDNSPVHTAAVVKRWFQQHPEIVLINWPPKSPDLNPIENLWAHITKEWMPENIRSKAHLLQHSRDTWEGMRRTPGLCQNLCDSMPRRLNQVIDELGSYTKY